MGVVRARAADANKQETHLSHRARPDAVQPARYDENVADEGQIEGVLRAQKTGTVEKKTDIGEKFSDTGSDSSSGDERIANPVLYIRDSFWRNSKPFETRFS